MIPFTRSVEPTEPTTTCYRNWLHDHNNRHAPKLSSLWRVRSAETLHPVCEKVDSDATDDDWIANISRASTATPKMATRLHSTTIVDQVIDHLAKSRAWTCRLHFHLRSRLSNCLSIKDQTNLLVCFRALPYAPVTHHHCAPSSTQRVCAEYRRQLKHHLRALDTVYSPAEQLRNFATNMCFVLF